MSSRPRSKAVCLARASATREQTTHYITTRNPPPRRRPEELCWSFPPWRSLRGGRGGRLPFPLTRRWPTNTLRHPANAFREVQNGRGGTTNTHVAQTHGDVYLQPAPVNHTGASSSRRRPDTSFARGSSLPAEAFLSVFASAHVFHSGSLAPGAPRAPCVTTASHHAFAGPRAPPA